MPEYLPALLDGLRVTVEVALTSAVLALLGSFIVGLARLAPSQGVRSVARTYVEIFRGTSALVQLFYAYFVLPAIGIELTAYQAAISALALNSSAYGSEIVRSAVVAVPKGQREAAHAVGLSRARTMERIILPQALPRMLPPFGNLLVEHIKTTSLVSLITVADLAFAGQALLQTNGEATRIYLTVLLMYFAVCFPLSQLTRFVEQWLVRRGVVETKRS